MYFLLHRPGGTDERDQEVLEADPHGAESLDIEPVTLSSVADRPGRPGTTSWPAGRGEPREVDKLVASG